MQVNAKVHESQIDKIKPGCRPRSGSMPFAERGAQRHGQESHPCPTRATSSAPTSRSTPPTIKIDDALPGLRPGMTAQVEILVNRARERPERSRPGDPRVQWQGPRDQEGRRPVSTASRSTLGISNDKFVEVTKGLNDGDFVALNPMSLDERGREARRVRLASKDAEERLGRRRAEEPPRPWPARTPATARAAPEARARAAIAGQGQRRKGQGQGRGGGGAASSRRLRASSQKREAQLKTASPRRRRQILKKAGLHRRRRSSRWRRCDEELRRRWRWRSAAVVAAAAARRRRSGRRTTSESNNADCGHVGRQADRQAGRRDRRRT